MHSESLFCRSSSNRKPLNRKVISNKKLMGYQGFLFDFELFPTINWIVSKQHYLKLKQPRAHSCYFPTFLLLFLTFWERKVSRNMTYQLTQSAVHMQAHKTQEGPNHEWKETQWEVGKSGLVHCCKLLSNWCSTN